MTIRKSSFRDSGTSMLDRSYEEIEFLEKIRNSSWRWSYHLETLSDKARDADRTLEFDSREILHLLEIVLFSVNLAEISSIPQSSKTTTHMHRLARSDPERYSTLKIQLENRIEIIQFLQEIQIRNWQKIEIQTSSLKFLKEAVSSSSPLMSKGYGFPSTRVNGFISRKVKSKSGKWD